MLITKADGTQEEFRPNKLRSSLQRAGAHKDEVNQIVAKIMADLKEGDHTQTIYKKAFDLLRESENPIAARYSLRRAVLNLGPTGFPFEDFIARLFEIEGYITKTRVLIKGRCTTHEIDVAGYSADDSFVVEAKFHAHPGIKSDLQVAMYSYARFLDLKAQPVCRQDSCGIDTLYIVTNTKFTRAAEQYAGCVGISLLSWNFPKGNTLQDRIERAGIYPITVLTTLSTRHKRYLLENNVILCRDLLGNQNMLLHAGVPNSKVHTVLNEATLLCGKGLIEN